MLSGQAMSGEKTLVQKVIREIVIFHMTNENPRRERRRDALLQALTRFAGRPAGLKELLQKAGLHSGEQTEAKRILRQLVTEGEARRDGKRWALASAAPPPPPDEGGGQKKPASHGRATPRPSGYLPAPVL